MDDKLQWLHVSPVEELQLKEQHERPDEHWLHRLFCELQYQRCRNSSLTAMTETQAKMLGPLKIELSYLKQQVQFFRRKVEDLEKKLEKTNEPWITGEM